MVQSDEFKGKTALITGGTKGLGYATALQLAQKGVNLFLTFRSDEETARQAIAQIESHGVHCQAVCSDLANDDGTEKLFEQLYRAGCQKLDFYIHNAAATSFKDLLELESHHIDKTFNISVKALILAMKKVVPMMEGGGAVVTVSGMDNLRAVPRHGLLGAAKSALETLSAYYAHELAPRGIRVNSVNPGFFASDSTRKYLGGNFQTIQSQFARALPSRKSPSLDDISSIILFLLSSKANWLVGQTLVADGGFDFALPI